MFILFTLFIYSICECFKYKKIATIRNKVQKGRLYNEPVCYVKLFFIVLSYLLVIINRLTVGVLENSSGFKGFVTLSVIYFILILVSILDVKRIKAGYNKVLLGVQEGFNNEEM